MKGAIAHTTVYAIVNAFLIAIWALTTIDADPAGLLDDPTTINADFWPIWPILGWGLAVALHVALAALAAPGKAARHIRNGGNTERRNEQLARRTARHEARAAERTARRDGQSAIEPPRVQTPEIRTTDIRLPDVVGKALSDVDQLVTKLLQGTDHRGPAERSEVNASGEATAPEAPHEPQAPTTDLAASTFSDAPASSAPSPLRRTAVTVLFTDIVGSTSLNETLGDEAYATMLTVHRSMVRRVIGEYGGTEVGTQGDGFLVRFATPTAGVDAACAIARAASEGRSRGEFEPQLRMGLHCGEAMQDEEDLVGTVVNLAARVCGAAAPGEIIVTEPVADRLTHQINLIDRGLVELRGLRQQRHLLQVDWDDQALDRSAGEDMPAR